jgi:hypothetical protein
VTYHGYNNRDAAQLGGEKILFWRDESSDKFANALSAALPGFGAWLIQARGDSPKDFVRHDIPYEDRIAVARALEIQSTMNPGGGHHGISYMGWANCRICGEKLGTRDMFGYGFVWPERAEHYLLSHNVWTTGCDRLLVAVRKAGK